MLIGVQVGLRGENQRWLIVFFAKLSNYLQRTAQQVGQQSVATGLDSPGSHGLTDGTVVVVPTAEHDQLPLRC